MVGLLGGSRFALSVVPVENCGVALDLESTSEAFLHCSINLSEPDLALELSGCLVPLRLKCLAVTAPGCVELNHPDVFGAEDDGVEVGIGQYSHIFVCSGTSTSTATTAAGVRRGRALFGFGSLVDLGDGLVEGELADAVSVPTRGVVHWLLLVVAEELDSWESLDVVGGTHTLVFGHVDGANFDHTLEMLGS